MTGKTWGVDGRCYVKEKQGMQTSRDADLVSSWVSGSPLAEGTCRKDKAKKVQLFGVFKVGADSFCFWVTPRAGVGLFAGMFPLAMQFL